MGMLLVAWLVEAVARSSQTVSIDREVLKALQSAVHEVVKDQKDLVSRVDDQYLDLLSRINDLSTGVRKMSHVFREPLAAGKLEEIIQVEGGEGRTTMVFCIVSAFLAVLMHFTLSRRDGPLTVGQIEDSTSLRRCEQATLQCGVMNPPPAYNPEVVPIEYSRKDPVLPVIPRPRRILLTTPKTEVKERRLSACVVCMASRSTHAIVPCGHRCCCALCHTRLKRCPLCSETISSVVKIYD
ncbi:hypothetical protein FOZ60_002057 [Perkinsus olseni]|uniref:RING-type domain-containing protein n=1 Tax=Perkinsus olseni TaxID=32597 RepID=A0A7J6NZU3_PEROL|nr:hypothetical protein FOZ60_002057 [Perkinsus olseni]